MNNPFNISLDLSDLLLRPLTMDDDKDMFEYTSMTEVTKHLSWDAHKDIEQARTYIQTVLDEYQTTSSCFTWGVVLKSEQKLIGIVRLFDISLSNKRAELSYIINPHYQGKGYVQKAIRGVIKFGFSNGYLHRFQARCTLDNSASENLMKKLGMRHEGTLKNYWINKGIVSDAKLYALCEEDANF